MALQDQIIIQNLEDFNRQIADDILRKGINNTGDAIRSLKVVVSGDKFRSVGNDYIEVLDKGRSPGKFAPVGDINEWVKTKLGITEDKELKQVSFLVNRKIAREGTDIFNNKSKGLEIDEKIDNLNDKLRKDLIVFARADVLRQLNKFQKQRQEL